jgi:branched-chain amino acid transport system substrate-binding protein
MTYPEDLFEKPEKYRDAVVFGHLMDRSSDAHAHREKASRLAAVQLGVEGGLDGQTLAVVFCTYEENSSYDDLTPADAAVASAKYLSGVLGTPAIIGPAGSSDVERVFNEVREDGTLVISPSATSPALTDLEQDASDAKPGLLWRTAPPDSLQGSKIATDMKSRDVTKVAVIYQAGAYGEGLATVFQDNFKPNKADVKPFSSENERIQMITDVGSSSASEVLFISSAQADVIAFLSAVEKNPTYASKTLFLTDSAASQDVIDKSPASVYEKIRGTRPSPIDPSDPVYTNFVGAYGGEYGMGDDVSKFSFTAHAFDAAWLVFYGTAWSKLQTDAITGTGIAAGLRKISSGPPVNIQPLSWKGLVEKFRSGTGVDVHGASGELNYDPVTEETSAEIQVWHIVTGGTSPSGHQVEAL